MSYHAHIIIHGRVQGVGFRFWVQRTASGKGLTGFVRNHSDGTVEAKFSGDRESVEEMVEVCRNGPPGARVTEIVRLNEASLVEENSDDVSSPFTILGTV